jgi:hypothetical protein
MRGTGQRPVHAFRTGRRHDTRERLGQLPPTGGARTDNEEERVTMIRPFRRVMVLAVGAAVILGACSSGGAGGSAAAGATIPNVPQTLIDAAKAEGNLTTIALPHSWCNYGKMLTDFTAKFGIKINELNPDGGSKDEITAIEANKTNKGPAAPDVIDVGLSFGPQAKAAGDIQPYKVATWDSIPATAKDADG